jgi:hypothetical protein
MLRGNHRLPAGRKLLLDVREQRASLHVRALYVRDQGRRQRRGSAGRLALAHADYAERVGQVVPDSRSRRTGSAASGIGTTSIATTLGPALSCASASIRYFASTPWVRRSAGRVMFTDIGSRKGRSLKVVAYPQL